MTSAYTSIFIEVRDRPWLKSRVLSGENMDNVTLEWRDPQTLRIGYSGGDVTDFNNRWAPPFHLTTEQIVRVELKRSNVR